LPICQDSNAKKPESVAKLKGKKCFIFIYKQRKKYIKSSRNQDQQYFNYKEQCMKTNQQFQLEYQNHA